jgi:hypothetical protein
MGEEKVRGFGGVCTKRKAGGNSGYMPVIIFRRKPGSVLPCVFLNAPGAGFAKAALAATAESRFRQDGTPTKKKSTSFESGTPKDRGLQEGRPLTLNGFSSRSLPEASGSMRACLCRVLLAGTPTETADPSVAGNKAKGFCNRLQSPTETSSTLTDRYELQPAILEPHP